MTIDLEKARTALLARKEELETLSTMAEGARDTVTLDQQSVGRLSRMDALQQQAMAQATERQRVAELQRIANALQLIEDGDYGWCDICGDAIPRKRLEIDPSVTVCVRCAGQ